MKTWRTLLSSCVAFMVIATGFSSAFFSGPSFASGNPSMITISLVGSFLVLAIFLALSWRKSIGIAQVYAAMMIVALLSILIYAMGYYDGALPTFGIAPLFIGLMLASMPFKRATAVVIIGFGCSGLAYPLFHLINGFSNTLIAQIMSIAFYIAATGFFLLNGKATNNWPPVRETWITRETEIPAQSTLGTRKVSIVIFLVALTLFFASFGMYEVFAEHEGVGYTYLDGSLMPVVVSMVVLLVVALRFDFRSWAGSTLGLSWIAFIASLFLTLVISDTFSLVFSVLGTVMVVMHIVVWLAVLDEARTASISPVFLFTIVTATMKLAQHVGRLASDVLISQTGASIQSMSTIAACFLAVASIVAGGLVFASIRAASKAASERADAIASDQPHQTSPETAWTRALTDTCQAHGFSQRETEIIGLYCREGARPPSASRCIWRSLP